MGISDITEGDWDKHAEEEFMSRDTYDLGWHEGYAKAIEDMTKCKDSLCHSCKQYDREHYKCPIWCKVISGTIDEIKYQVRAKAIDEFANLLISDEVQKYELDAVFETNRELSYSDCCLALEDYVKTCAEQIKEQTE